MSVAARPNISSATALPLGDKNRNPLRNSIRRASSDWCRSPDNVQQSPGFICNCCGCCCGMLSAMGTHGLKMTVHTSNYIASVADECIGCGKCVKACPVKALETDTRAPRGATAPNQRNSRGWTNPSASAAGCARAHAT